MIYIEVSPSCYKGNGCKELPGHRIQASKTQAEFVAEIDYHKGLLREMYAAEPEGFEPEDIEYLERQATNADVEVTITCKGRGLRGCKAVIDSSLELKGCVPVTEGYAEHL